MNFAIIAAGEGSRLAKEGIEQPKPLVRVAGEPLIDRLVRIFNDNGADEICVICNEEATQVGHHLMYIQNNGLQGRPIPLRFKVKSTPSSMHSLYELSDWLDSSKFILTTVDTIFSEKEFAAYVKAFSEADDIDGLMGVTAFVDDEKPLWVGTGADMTIEGFYDQNTVGAKFISAGIYGLGPKSLGVLRDCVGRGESRMRNFQRALISSGLGLRAYEFGKVVDIDHARDIATAEKFLSVKR